MPNNCSTLIQRKQNILHKILRSNSEGKIQDAVNETTAALCVAGTRKTPAYSPTSTSNLTAASATRRATAVPSNRIQPTPNHLYETHFPSIRDPTDNSEQPIQSHDEIHHRTQSKRPLTNASPKSNGHAPSTSISSIFNALTKRSSENFMSTYGEFDEANNPNAVIASRRVQTAANKEVEINQNLIPQKQSIDNGSDARMPSASRHLNQQRTIGSSARVRVNVPQIHIEAANIQEAVNKERSTPGQLYQRRTNHNAKAPIKQKIDKYRRRSGEALQAAYGNGQINTANNGLSSNSPSLVPSPLNRPKQLTPSPTAVHRVSSDAEIEARLEVLRLSMDGNLIHVNKQSPTQTHYGSNARIKSPYFSNSHQQMVPRLSPSNPPTPPVRLRRTHGITQPISSASSSRHVKHHQQQQQQNLLKQSTKSGSGNVYLAFISSRHFSTLDEAFFDYDLDHQKLLNIFTWIRGVEEHRHEQSDHDQLLQEQCQRMLDLAENFSLYSEIQQAVDDLPANTSGKPCEKIQTMSFEH